MFVSIATSFFTKQSEAVENTLRLNIEAVNYTDEILLRFNDTATPDYDPDWDARKLAGSAEAPQLSIVSDDNEQLSISTMPQKEGELIIPLHFTLNTSGMATFTGSGMETFNPLTTIYLEDQELNKVTDLRTNAEYTFSHQAGAAADRFRLRISMLTGLPGNQGVMPGTAFFGNSFLNLQVPEMDGQTVEISIYNGLGGKILHTSMIMQGLLKLPVTPGNGMYIVKVISGKEAFVKKLIYIKR